MSTSLRVLAGTVAAVIAVLTGIATGLMSAHDDCTATTSTTTGGPPTFAAPRVPTATPRESASSTGGGFDNAQPPALTATPPASGAPSGTPSEQPDVPLRPTDTVTTSAPVVECTAVTFDADAALTAFLGALLVGASLIMLLAMAQRRRPVPVGAGARPPTPPAPVPAAPPVPAVPPAAGRVDTDRAALVQVAIYVRDRVTSRALADRLGAALHDAGVVTLEPTGVRFDPAHHEAGGTAPTTDQTLVGLIAAVEVPGYADRGGRILRAPVVTVYQATATGEDR